MLLIVGFVLAVITIVAFLVYRNLKDEKKFEKELNKEDEHSLHHSKVEKRL